MDEQKLLNAIAHFDKKVTDYQIYVDRELQKQNKHIKSLENYIKNALKDNVLGGAAGLTDTARTLLMEVLRNAVYTSNQSANLNALEEALKEKLSGGDDNTGDDNTGDDNTGDDNTGDDNTGDDNTGDDNTGDDNTGDDNTGGDITIKVIYTVTNNLFNCANSNNAANIEENTSYYAVISANNGYYLQSVVVTMGGENVDVTDGVINIPNVTGDIVITAVAVDEIPTIPAVFTITNNLTNCTNSNSAETINSDTSYYAVITANGSYQLSSVVVTMGGSNVNVTGGVIDISNVTGDIVITAVATYTVTEILQPTFIEESYPDITTFAYTQITTDKTAAEVYKDGTLFLPSTYSGGTLHLTLDTTKISQVRFLVYVFDSNGQPYQLLKGTTSIGLSGKINEPQFVSPGTTPGWSTAVGSVSLEIPEDCNVMVQISPTGSTIIDTENYANLYDIADAIKAGEIVKAMVIKEVA